MMLFVLLLGRVGFVFSYFTKEDFATTNPSVTLELSTLQDIAQDLWTTLQDFFRLPFSSATPQPQEDEKNTTSWSASPHFNLSHEFTSRIDVSEPHTEQESTTISLDELVESISAIDLYHNDETIKELEEEYKLTNNQRAWARLVERYNHYYAYAKAYETFEGLASTTIKGMDPHLVMNTVLNSKLINSIQGISTIENLIAELRDAGSLSQKDSQRYRSLLLLINEGKTRFLEYVPHYEESDYGDLAQYTRDLQKKVSYASQGMDIPDYYSDGLIALGLFQYGYPKIAEHLSITILHNFPNYVLPKQILWYSNIVLRDWRQAQSYFLELIEQDPHNSSMYYFFIGIASYRMKDYKNSILYLDQIPLIDRISDIVRYKILSYHELGDNKNLARQLRSLLKYDDLSASDMILARESLVYEPLVDGAAYELLLEDRKLLDNYRATCETLSIDKDVCLLGDIASQALSAQYWTSSTSIKQLLQSFPKSYLYYVLGEYYYQEGKLKDAQKAFVSALSLSSNQASKKRITEKIKQLF